MAESPFGIFGWGRATQTEAFPAHGAQHLAGLRRADRQAGLVGKQENLAATGTLDRLTCVAVFCTQPASALAVDPDAHPNYPFPKASAVPRRDMPRRVLRAPPVAALLNWFDHFPPGQSPTGRRTSCRPGRLDILPPPL